jgi:hypothetical protein
VLGCCMATGHLRPTRVVPAVQSYVLCSLIQRSLHFVHCKHGSCVGHRGMRLGRRCRSRSWNRYVRCRCADLCVLCCAVLCANTVADLSLFANRATYCTKLSQRSGCAWIPCVLTRTYACEIGVRYTGQAGRIRTCTHRSSDLPVLIHCMSHCTLAPYTSSTPESTAA